MRRRTASGPSLPSSAPESWRRNSSVQPPCSASGFTSPLSRNRSFPDLPLSADPEIISRVLDNILSNAAAHASCTVTLRLSLKQGALLAEVSDDGPGFTTAALEKGCDPFFTEARDNGHQGLGLYTSCLLCLAHHGSLTLANAPEGGAGWPPLFCCSRIQRHRKKRGTKDCPRPLPPQMPPRFTILSLLIEPLPGFPHSDIFPKPDKKLERMPVY